MKIVVFSDTHLKVWAIPELILEDLKSCDMILHAGDITSMNLIHELEAYAKVHAVCGNMDETEVKDALPSKKILEIDGLKIGLIHGYGAPFGIRKRILKEFEDVNCIVYGHTHRAYFDFENNIYFFNPGSPTDRIFAPFKSYGILEVSNGKIKGEIIRL